MRLADTAFRCYKRKKDIVILNLMGRNKDNKEKIYDVEFTVAKGGQAPLSKKYHVEERGREITITEEGGAPTLYLNRNFPNISRRARIISNAKGERTLAQFAEVCDSSAATLSRFMTGNNGLVGKSAYSNKPMSIELILKVVGNAAELPEGARSSGSNVTVDELMAANGYLLTNEAAEQDEHYMWRRESDQNQEIIDSARRVFIQALIDEGYMVGTASREDIPVSARYGLVMYSNHRLRFNVSRDGDSFIWIVHTGLVNEYYRDHPARVAPDFFSDCAPFFLRDMWEPDSLQNLRYTVLLTEEGYKETVSRLSDIEVNNYISLQELFILDNTCRFGDEYIIPRRDGCIGS